MSSPMLSRKPDSYCSERQEWTCVGRWAFSLACSEMVQDKTATAQAPLEIWTTPINSVAETSSPKSNLPAIVVMTILGATNG
jgi:hypothetical protein